jgi:hypothetical protein
MSRHTAPATDCSWKNSTEVVIVTVYPRQNVGSSVVQLYYCTVAASHFPALSEATLICMP